MSKLGLRVVDLVDACAELDSLDSETLLTLTFACSSMLLVTCSLAFVVVYTSTLDILTLACLNFDGIQYHMHFVVAYLEDFVVVVIVPKSFALMVMWVAPL